MASPSSNTNNLDAALKRMLADIGTYYLLGYYSTNTRLDGRFRKLTVRVKRPGVEVRARPGYLAPTEEEAAAARGSTTAATGSSAAAAANEPPPEIRRALEKLAPARSNLPVRLHAAAGAAQIWITGELDAGTLKDPEWAQGGRAKVTLAREGGAAPPIVKEVTLEPGQRVLSVVHQEAPLPEGRFTIAVSLIANGGTLPLQGSADVIIPPKAAFVGASGIVSRRGPSTGLAYHETADARFKRTERLRLQLPKIAADATATSRLLSRNGQPMPLAVTLSEAADQKTQAPMIVCDLTLAPLAQGEYVLEVRVEKDGKTETAAYAFRIVP